ncbi:MAG: hypothetical protein ACTTIO_00050 [Candidatus Fimenecus sp.]
MENNKKEIDNKEQQNVNPYSAQTGTYSSPVKNDEAAPIAKQQTQDTNYSQPVNQQPQNMPYSQPVNQQPQNMPYSQPVNQQPQNMPYSQPVNQQPQNTPYSQPVNQQPQNTPYAQPVNQYSQGVPYGQTYSPYAQSNGTYGNQGYAPTYAKKKSSISIAAIILTFFSPLIGLILGIVAKANAKKKPNEDNSLALPAIIISAIFIVLQISAVFIAFQLVNKEYINNIFEREYSSVFSEYTKGTTTKKSSSESQLSSEKTYTKHSVKLGQTLITNNTKIAYKSFKYVDSLPKNNPSYQLAEGKKIIRIEYTFENKTNEKISLAPIYCYADNVLCDRVRGYEDEKSSSAHRSVIAAESFTVVEYFEVPAEVKMIQFKETVIHSNGTERIIFVVK